MTSSSKVVLPDVQFIPRAYKVGIPGGGNPEDETDPLVRVRRLEQSYQARIANLDQQLAAEREKAFAEGFAQGEKEASDRARVEFDEERRRWASLMQQLTTARRDIFRASESQLVQLVIAAVEKIIAGRPYHPEKIAETLREAFDLLVTKDKLTIICAPGDASFIKDLLADHRDEFEDIAKFTVREDPAITPGGCLVETEWGTIDARVEKRVAALKQIWREATMAPPPDQDEDES